MKSREASPTSLRRPQQDRSRRTLDRLLDAAEALLETRPFESMTIADIVRKAKSSVGSFYARFPNKDALLPALYARYDADMRRRTEALFARLERPGTSLDEMVDACIDLAIRLFTERRWLMRAMVIYARLHPDEIGPDTRAQRSMHSRRVIELLMSHRDRIAHPEPRQAIEVGLFTVTCVIRERLLFGEAPHASTFELDRDDLRREMRRVFLGYLGIEPGSGPKKTD